MAPGRFALSPLAQPLRSDHPLSLRAAYPLLGADVQAWAHLDYSVRTGRPAFDLVHRQPLWDYLAQHPQASAGFDRGIEALTRLELRAILQAYDWQALIASWTSAAGTGGLLAGLLKRHPAMHAILLDLPDVVAGAAGVLQDAGVADRCEVVAGSFFDQVPASADAYLLKRILYGWDDARAREILIAVRTAMHPDSRVLILEPILDVSGNTTRTALLDVMMLTIDGGQARTPAQLETLFRAAGLEPTRLVETVMFPILEGRLAR